jgi:two-component system phosphate regulon sensor histidine kinase PhoR
VKIRHKLLLILVAASGAAALLTAALTGRVLDAESLANARARLWSEARLIAGWAETVGPDADLPRFAFEAGRLLETRITLIGADGRVLGDSSRQADELTGMDDHRGRPEIVEAERSGAGTAIRRSGTFDRPYLYVAVRVARQDGPVRFVRAALPFDRIEAAQAASRRVLFAFSIASLLVLSAIAYVLVRRLSKPIEAMSRSAEQVADGRADAVIAYSAGDEVGRLADSLNRMRGALTDKITELDDERRLLLSVLGGMREGLVLVGPDRRIRLANEAFRQNFGLTIEPRGRLLAEVVRDPTVLRDLEAAQAEGREVRDLVLQAAGSGRSFELHVTPLEARTGGARGALFLFFDITRLEALEGVRREFVANVSHELRTPLTSIKAFVETLLEGRLEDRVNSLRFLEIVRKHAGRMEALIEDLTDLSLIETGAVSLEPQPVDLGDLAAEVASNVSPRAAALGVVVRVEVPPGFRVYADRMRLEQILVNLVENGVKFNRPGGSVTVRGEDLDGARRVLVEDTGIGIPADSLERVFHRFYRVDKARSKEMGGTGLGLSIVKHLMRLHGGQIRLESELGQGARFILEFPPEPAG